MPEGCSVSIQNLRMDMENAFIAVPFLKLAEYLFPVSLIEGPVCSLLLTHIVKLQRRFKL